MYNFGETMLMVASDRISAFDVIMPTPIPDKGRVLTALSVFWFERTAELAPNHLITIEQDEFPPAARMTPDLSGRAMLVRRLTMMPIECVVRGYLAGSGWKDYQATGTVCGHRLPAGPAGVGQAAESRSSRPPPRPPTATTTTSTRATAALLVGDELRYQSLERMSLEIYEHASAYAARARHHHRRHQVRVRHRPDRRADPGRRSADARLVALLAGRRVSRRAARSRRSTSSSCATGSRPALGQDSRPAPELPDDVVAGTRDRYLEAYERLTGEPFSAYLQRNGATQP